MPDKKPAAAKATLGVFSLALINVAAVVSLRNLPTMAEYGFTLVFFFVFSALFFFIPSALVAAELATGWSKAGGVYLWVKEGMGPKWGFVAIFMQWVENLPWFPAVLAFVASSMAYIINPELASSKSYTVAVIWIALWGCTFLNFKGMSWSSFVSSTGAIAGTLIPGALIIILGAVWVVEGKPSAITFSVQTFFPDITNMQQIMLLAGMLMAMTGMEMSAVHIHEVKDPKKDYPKAIFLSTGIIVALCILASLAIAIVVPHAKLSLSAGVMEAFKDFLTAHHIEWAVPIIAVLISYGALAMVSTWIVGPAKGLLEVAREGYLPRSWQKLNTARMPVNVLYIQAGLCSVLSLVILVMPTVSSAFWLMSALAVQLYLVMYLLMFASAIRLRYTQPDVERAYKIPGGNWGMWVVGGVGFVASLFAILCGFLPPDSVKAKGDLAVVGYVGFLFVGCVVFTAAPLVLYKISKNRPDWKPAEGEAGSDE